MMQRFGIEVNKALTKPGYYTGFGVSRLRALRSALVEVNPASRGSATRDHLHWIDQH